MHKFDELLILCINRMQSACTPHYINTLEHALGDQTVCRRQFRQYLIL
jgi:hypothetical protein